MNSSTLKPISHQTVTKATAGMNSGIVRNTDTLLPAVEGRDEILRDAEILVEHPAPDAEHDRDRQDVGEEERREHDALQPALQPIDAERDDEREQRARDDRQDDEIDGVPDRDGEQAVRREAEIIVEADPLARADQRRVGEGSARTILIVG